MPETGLDLTIIVSGGSVYDTFEAATRAAGGVANFYGGGGSTRPSGSSGSQPARPAPPPPPPPPPITAAPTIDVPEVVVAAPREEPQSWIPPSIAEFGFGPVVGGLGVGPSPAPRPKPRTAPRPRRTRPSPQRTRPQRPQSPPKPVRYTPAPPPAPSIMRRLASLLGRFASRVAGPLGLLLYSEPAGPDDEYPTGPVLFPPKFEEPRNERRDSPEPTADLGTVEVRGRYPRPAPTPRVEPSYRPSPLGPPALDPLPFAAPDLLAPRPAPSGRQQPRSRPAPAPSADPVPTPGSPTGELNPFPRPRPKPATRPLPFAPPQPSPNAPTGPELTPSSPTESPPKTEASKCNCPAPRQPKKKEKKKKKRTECYRGTYTELKSGLRKYRKEKIPCR